MESTVILIVGAIVLGCGSMGLLIARLTHSSFKGLGWLGGAFLAGSLGAGLLARQSESLVLLADLLMLLAFILLHVGVLELTGDATRVPYSGFLLLALQVLADVFLPSVLSTRHFRILVVSLLIALQAGYTGLMLWRFSRTQIRYPATFTSVLLLSFAAYNLLWAVTVVLGGLHQNQLAYQLMLVTYVLYLAVALGVAFGFFWMTTALLSSQLDTLASTDPLTRLFNRRVFLLWCEKELRRVRTEGETFSILMIDLDHFKRVNDQFGHSAGDQAICAAVEQMQDSVRGVDILARWGGEEFTCMLPNTGLEAAHIVAERMRANIEKVILNIPRGPASLTRQLRLTASIGITTYRGLDDLANMLERADRGLYQAKDSGRNRVCAHLGSGKASLALANM